MSWRVALGLLACAFGCDASEEESAPVTPPPSTESEERAEGPVECPERMVELSTGTCMDRHEARLEGERAVSAEGQLPANGLSFHAAAAACDASGFRLCTRDEWNAACGGAEHHAYPYGAEYEQDRCNSAPDASDLHGRELAPSGSHERCVSPAGVYDLSGNIGEWIDSADATGDLRELRGGSFANYPRRVTCEFEHNAYQPPEAAFRGQGFRCCTG